MANQPKTGRRPEPGRSDRRYCSAREAAGELGVSAATLYAYVSRGLVRSEAHAGGRRDRRYHREDIERLKEGRAQRRDPDRAAARALNMGGPVLESSLTLIADGRLHYRGLDAIALAGTHSVERIAGLLWLDDLSAAQLTEAFAGAFANSAATPKAAPARAASAASFAERFQIALALAAARDPLAWDLRPAAVAQTGARILRLLVGVAGGAEEPGAATASIAERLARAWAPRTPAAARILNGALVICADHELNVSTFTARCVASASATPYHVVIAGLAALQGAKHGGYTERADALLAEIREPRNARAVLLRHLKEGKGLPGFGHALYPQGDPRARLLLELAASSAASSGARPQAVAAMALARQTLRAAAALSAEPPNLDFGLATIRHVLNLPPGSGLAIFALGRTIGWIAHAIEQYKLDRLIRPRARYTGPQPPE